MIILREYQRQACRDTMEKFSRVRSVCLVSPTGSGKTVTGTALVAAFVRRSKRVLFVAHRRELITQSARVLRQAIGSHAVGVIMPGHVSTPSCPVQVGSIQTMLAQGFPPDIDFLVLDECHHYPADEWGRANSHYPTAKVLGLTATPERRDGRPLGDMFDEIVVAAQHSTLLDDGFLVPCRIVSAGIARVVFIEPYPKSKAAEFHEDSIQVGFRAGAGGDPGPTRVRFEPFVGVGPRRFFDLFSVRLGSGYHLKRKDARGERLEWKPENGRLRLQMLPASYLDLELLASDMFNKARGVEEEADAE